MMEGVIGSLIPIIAITGFFAWMIAISPVGRAFADRLRRVPDGAGREEIVTGLEDLRREVAELAERVDFAERLLARHREAERLEGPR